jgi:TRAP-type uncharacterized transport system substrate-binding protein
VFLGLRTSWLSREAVILGKYMGVLAATAALLWLDILALYLPAQAIHALPTWSVPVTHGAAIIIGLAGLYSSAMIYIATRRPLWRRTATPEDPRRWSPMLARHHRAAPWLALLAALSLALAACNDELAEEAEDFDLEDEEEDPDPEEPAIDEGEPDPDAEQISWATSDVGSAGHTALVNLAALLNREWEGYQVDVLPTAGAVQSVIGYATGEFDGYYGADIAFFEMAQGVDRFEGFEEQAERMPVQSFWAYPMETGLAIHTRDADTLTAWGDLEGEPVFTGPAPWDVRANLERAMEAVDVGHEYIEVDTGVAGSSLDTGDIRGMIAYTTSEAEPAPWVVEAELQTDMHILNPSDDEVARLKQGQVLIGFLEPLTSEHLHLHEVIELQDLGPALRMTIDRPMQLILIPVKGDRLPPLQPILPRLRR